MASDQDVIVLGAGAGSLAAACVAAAEGLRALLLPLGTDAASPVGPGSTGDGIRLGSAAGAMLSERNSQNAFWTPLSCHWRQDGTQGVFPHTVTDRGKPGIIAVDGAGERFASEAVSYHEFALAMLRAPRANPAYLLCDRRSLWQYGLGAAGTPIAGLYACGNDMNSTFEGAYPGPGITLGPALTFGHLAARHLAATVALS